MLYLEDPNWPTIGNTAKIKTALMTNAAKRTTIDLTVWLAKAAHARVTFVILTLLAWPVRTRR